MNQLNYAKNFTHNEIRENFILPQIKEEISVQDFENTHGSPHDYPKVNPNYILPENLHNLGKTPNKETLNIDYNVTDTYSSVSPMVFGPPLWFTLHNSSMYYPKNPSPITRERMKHIILGIPVLLPCQSCSEHASAYIESRFNELDTVCSSGENLFKFFVDFHNYVNKRYNKPIFSYEEAMKLYSRDIKVTKISYK